MRSSRWWPRDSHRRHSVPLRAAPSNPLLPPPDQGPSDHRRDEEDIQETGDLSQPFDHAQFVGFDPQTADDEVVEYRQLHAKEEPNPTDSDRQQREIPRPSFEQPTDPSYPCESQMDLEPTARLAIAHAGEGFRKTKIPQTR